MTGGKRASRSRLGAISYGLSSANDSIEALGSVVLGEVIEQGNPSIDGGGGVPIWQLPT